MYIDHVFRFFWRRNTFARKMPEMALVLAQEPQIRVNHALSYCAILLVNVKVLSASAVSFNQTSDDDM
jgi:hypothetical protein